MVIINNGLKYQKIFLPHSKVFKDDSGILLNKGNILKVSYSKEKEQKTSGGVTHEDNEMLFNPLKMRKSHTKQKMMIQKGTMKFRIRQMTFLQKDAKNLLFVK